MADWGGIISGALQGGAKAVGNLAQGYIEDERRLDYAKQISDMEMEKQRRLEEFRTQNRYEDDVRRSDVNGQLYKNNMQAKRDETDLQTEAQKTRDQNRTRIAADDQIAFGQSAERQAGVRAEARARHIAGPGEALAAEQLRQLKTINNLRVKLSSTTDPDQREAIQSQIADMTGNTKSQKDLTLAMASLTKAKSDALRVLKDPDSTDQAKEEAQSALADLDLTISFTKRQLGIKDNPAAPKPGKPSGVDLRQFDANPSKRGATSGF